MATPAKKPKIAAKTPAKPSKTSAKKAPVTQKNILQKAEDVVGGAAKGIGDAWEKGQTARKGIWKDVKRPGSGN